MKIARYKIHHAADIFPLMSDDELAGLAAHIKLHGQHEPVVLLDGFLLDGRNRQRACEKLGIESTFRELDNCDDPTGFVLAANLHRRQLTTSQRAFAAARMAKLENGTNQHQQRVEGLQNCRPITVEDAARMFAVSPRSIETAKRVIEQAHPFVVTVFERGKISVFLAGRFVAKVMDKKEQLRIAKFGVGAIRNAVQTEHESKLEQHVKKLVRVIGNIQERWPPEHLTTLTEKLASLTKEIKEGIQCPDPRNRGEAGIRSLHQPRRLRAVR